MGEPWVPPSQTIGSPILKEEAPPMVIDRASETGLWGERNPAPLGPGGGRPSAMVSSLGRARASAQVNHLMTLRMFENSSVQTGCPGPVSSGFQRGSSTSVPSAAAFRATRTQIELLAPSRAAPGVTA